MSDRRRRTIYQQYNEKGELFCYKCKKYKSEDQFDSMPNKWFRNNKDYRCKQCKKEQTEKRRLCNRGKQDLDRLLLERFHAAKERAAKKNLEFNITTEYLKYLWFKQCGKCALSGIDMTYIFFNGRTPTNVSIDRILPEKGYTMDNIQLVCMACNQMKNDLIEEQLYEFCKKIVNKYENK